MDTEIKLKRKLHNALKLSGFIIRTEFISMIYDRFKQDGKDLSKNENFENCVKSITESLEKQGIIDKSIEGEHVLRALETALYSGQDKNETIFNVISAYEFPKLTYDLERKHYMLAFNKSTFLSEANSKAQLFLDRYQSILHRTLRNFKDKLGNDEADKLSLQKVDYLLTRNKITIDKTLLLGSLLQVSEGNFYLEDPTGIVKLDLSHCKYHGGFFVENSFALVNGYYDDKVLKVSTMILPPGEEYQDSRLSFSNLNYFGGASPTVLRDSINLKKYSQQNTDDIILFFSDIWLDHPEIFEKFDVLFTGLETSPPVAFVFMGSFLHESQGHERLAALKKYFKQLAQLLSSFPRLRNESRFVFVPSMNDPSTPHIAPRFSLPKAVTEDFTKHVPHSIFTTNPCRIQYCHREIVLFRADIVAKLMLGTLHKPEKTSVADYATRTILGQGHLTPLSLNAFPVHWDFDYTLRLYPLPNLIVVGDKSEGYRGKYKGCQLINPGSFCNNGFHFLSYTPYNEDVDDCVL